MSGRWPRFRVLFLAILFALAGGGITVRLAHVQFVNGTEYQRRAVDQSERIRKLIPRRGDILDRHGRELAISVPTQAVAARPALVEDPQATARTLAGILGLAAADIEKKLRSTSRYVYLCHQLPPERCRAVREAALPGIVLEPRSRRVYPNRTLAAHTLGFVGTDSQALGGVETAFDDAIRGRDGRAVDLTDAKGAPFSHRVVERAVPGDTLQLTLDLTVQHTLEEELDRAIRGARAKAGAAVAMDPLTGEILAVASWPTFNPNTFNEYSDEERRDRAMVNAYEPGSTFKVVTAAAALEQGLVQPNEVFFCGNGAYRIGRYTIRDHKRFADLSFTEVMARSSNVGAIKAGMRVPPQIFYDTARRFGFGDKTGIGLSGEHPGLLRSPDNWSLLSQPSLSIGQEILVTPLQLLTAVSAVANRGVLVRPWIARSLLDADGGVLRSFPPPVARRVVREDNAQTLTAMLEQVVLDGTGKAAAVPGYRVAGKTGTAQKSGPGGGGYLPGRYVASFVGYVPAQRPRLAAVFVIDEPRVEKFHGGDVAAPAFGRFAARVLGGLGVPPRPEGDGLAPERLVVRRSPAAPAGSVDVQFVTLHRTGGSDSPAAGVRNLAPRAQVPADSMPDLVGLTSREALARLTALGGVPHLTGSGRVAAQEPAAGTPLAAAEGYRLWLGHP